MFTGCLSLRKWQRIKEKQNKNKTRKTASDEQQ